jgi:hypothetical protein
MAASKPELICSICNKIFTSPVVHRHCGNTFDRDCLQRICPANGCGKVIQQGDLILDYNFQSIADEYRVSLIAPYYLFLLDTSTSMWYSDHRLGFLTGKSRLKLAVDVIQDFLISKYVSIFFFY